MSRPRLFGIAARLAGCAMLAAHAPPPAPAAPRLPRGNGWRWAIDYGAGTDARAARRYDLLVLEPDHAVPPAHVRRAGAVAIGYLSLGEIEKSRPFVAALAAAGALFAANPDWPDARMADLRHPRWRAEVLDRLVPAILARGYDGVFLDTLDNAEALERADPVAHAGMVQAAATLVREIRRRFPGIVIVVNRGYATLPAIAGAVDGVLGEAMATRWDFARRRYERLSDADWAWQAERLRAARAANPALALLTLDYWEPGDTRTVKGLYARERAAGFVPYVSVLSLNHIVAEPAP